ncbi:MAG: Uncharacterised protein [Euryarchaeota archaeon UBA443]|nr:MAG: Uncharacterised protein [Euryarchaeota archaeon UBA443]
MTLSGLSHTGPQVGVLIHFPKMLTPPLSLNIARMEPVRVIQPTSAERPAATMITVNSSSWVGTFAGSSTYFQISESATNADAAPPNPLNKATSSGIPVISTRIAIQRPMREPITRPEPIRTHSIPSPSPICRMVVITATSIPSAPS